MKTEYAIKTDIYNYLKKSELVVEVTGLLKKTSRPKNSTKEDIIISVLSNVNGQNQEAVVNVNIYVEDNIVDGQAEEDSARIGELSELASSILESFTVGGAVVYLEQQKVYEAEGIDWHVINNRLNYKINNE